MALYPIHIPRDLYSGRNPPRQRQAQRFNDLAERIERYINAEMESESSGRMFSYGTVALALGLAETEVEKILYGVDCGGNGLTVWKSG